MKDYAFQIENIETARKLSRHIEENLQTTQLLKKKMIKT